MLREDKNVLSEIFSKTILALLCGVILTISVFVLCLIPNTRTASGAGLGILLKAYPLFVRMFFWTDIFFEGDSGLLSFAANFIVFSTLSYIAISWLVEKEYLAH